MLKALAIAAGLTFGVASLVPVVAQETFVIVPDNPGGGGGGGGGRGGTAVTTTNLNVRNGPGTRYAVIDVLQRGETVRVNSCDGGWCRINHRGSSGWVSQNHLDRTGGGGGGGGGRPSREACFYEDTHFRGRSFCAAPGDSDRSLGSWNNRISSISIRGFPTVQVCSDRYFGDCDAFNRDVATLPWWLDRNVSSFRVLH